jgi:hypothetical protein
VTKKPRWLAAVLTVTTVTTLIKRVRDREGIRFYRVIEPPGDRGDSGDTPTPAPWLGHATPRKITDSLPHTLVP